MPVLICGLALLLTALMSHETGLRRLLIHHGGIWFYRTIISLFVVTGTALIILGRTESPFIQIWVPPWQWRAITYPLTMFAFILAGSELLPAGYLKRNLQRPVYAGMLLWGVAHLMTNGDLASILVFGSLALAALVKVSAGLYRSVLRLEGRTSGQHVQISVHWDIAAILLGLSVWGLLALYHGPLFGMALDLPV